MNGQSIKNGRIPSNRWRLVRSVFLSRSQKETCIVVSWCACTIHKHNDPPTPKTRAMQYEDCALCYLMFETKESCRIEDDPVVKVRRRLVCAECIIWATRCVDETKTTHPHVLSMMRDNLATPSYPIDGQCAECNQRPALAWNVVHCDHDHHQLLQDVLSSPDLDPKPPASTAGDQKTIVTPTTVESESETDADKRWPFGWWVLTSLAAEPSASNASTVLE